MVTNNLSLEAKDKLNNLLRLFFKANSVADNIAYALDCELNCPIASELFHENFAHVFPSDKYADKLSAIMVHEGVRPRRVGFDGDIEDYENIVIAFEDCYRMMADVKGEILRMIDFLDYDPMAHVFVIELEDMSKTASTMLHQCDIWRRKAKAYYDRNDVTGFDVHFADFSKFEF